MPPGGDLLRGTHRSYRRLHGQLCQGKPVSAAFGLPRDPEYARQFVGRHPANDKATHKKLLAKDRTLAKDFLFLQADFDKLLHAWFGNSIKL
jgi:hypothetical protein